MSGVGLNPEQYQHRKTGVGPISKHPSTMPRPALIVFSKVRVENLPQEGTGLVKVKFRCGGTAEETVPQHANPDGSAEWTLPLDVTLFDADIAFFAVVLQQLRPGDWSLVPGFRFEAPIASALPTVWHPPPDTKVWRPPSDTPINRGPKFYAELELFLDEGTPRDTRLPPYAGRRTFGSDSFGDGSRGGGYVSGSSSGYADAWGGGESGEQWPSQAEGLGLRRAHTEDAPSASGSMPTVPAIAVAAAAPPTAPAQPPSMWGGAMRRDRPFGGAPPNALMQRARSAGYLVRDSSQRSSGSSFTGLRLDSSMSDEQGGREPSPPRSNDARYPSPVGTVSGSKILDESCPLDEDGDGHSTPVGVVRRSGILDPSQPLDERTHEPLWGGPAFKKLSEPDEKLGVTDTEDHLEEVKTEPRWDGDRRGAPRAAAAPAPAKKGLMSKMKRWLSDGNKPAGTRSSSADGVTRSEAQRKTKELESPYQATGTAHTVEREAQQQAPIKTGTSREATQRRAERSSVSDEGILALMRQSGEQEARRGRAHGHEQLGAARAQAYGASPYDARGVSGADDGAVRKTRLKAAGAPKPSRVDSRSYGGEVSLPVNIRLRRRAKKGKLNQASPTPSVSQEAIEPRVRELHTMQMQEAGTMPVGAQPLPSPPPLPLRQSPDAPAPPPPYDEAILQPTAPSVAAARLRPLSTWERALSPSELAAMSISPRFGRGEEDGGMNDDEYQHRSYAFACALGPTELEQQWERGGAGAREEEKGEDGSLPGYGYMAMPKNSLGTLDLTGQPISPEVPSREVNVEPKPSETTWREGRYNLGEVRTPARNASILANEPAHGHRTRALQPPRSWSPVDAGADPVCFSCFSPPTVSEGVAFLLRVSAYLRQAKDEVLRNAASDGVAEAGVPGGMSIVRGKRVTVCLELPEDVFRVMPPDDEGPGRTCEHPPSVREFVWTGEEARADFKVGCRPGAQPGVVQCRARVVEGANVTCLSFHVEVVPPGSAARAIAVTDLQKLDVTLEKVRGNVAVIPQEDLEFHGALGEGIQGVTFGGVWRGKRVAIKRLAECSTRSSVALSRSDLEHEATILSLLGHHPNIVEFYGLSRRGGGMNGEDGSVDVVTKFEEGGSLEDALGLRPKKNGRAPTNGNGYGWGGHRGEVTSDVSGRLRAAWMRDVACGLANSHAARVVHNDVASRNVLLSERGADGSALLCDYGISRLLQVNEAACLIDLGEGERRWPLRQMPPEALGEPYALSPESDAWMYGTMLYEVFEGRPPFAGLAPAEVMRLVREGKTLETPELLTHQGPKLRSVFERCMRSDPNRRPSMEDVVQILSVNRNDGPSMALW